MTTIRRQRFKHIIGRTVLLIFGMFLAAFGIACTTTAGLGTTPISTVPYTASAITGLSFGTCTVILNFFFVAGQIVVLRSRYSPFNLLQIPIGFIFGAFIDLSMHLVGNVQMPNWFLAAVLSLFGNLILALGTVIQIRSKTIVQPGEGFVIAIAALVKSSFGSMKIANDISLTAVAAIMALVEMGHLIGIREGTLASALMIGLFAKWIDQLINRRAVKVQPAEPHEVPLDSAAQTGIEKTAEVSMPEVKQEAVS